MNKIYTNNEDILNINKIAVFLARRDIKKLTKSNFLKTINNPQVDLLILLGNSIPYTAKLAADVYVEDLAKMLMIVGGIGHSTEYLRENIIRIKKYKDISFKDRSESEILQDFICEYLARDIKKEIMLEKKSTNCGSNAQEALKLCIEKNLNPKSILLIQDPTMQLRTYASFIKVWSSREVKFINFAPFIPLVEKDNESFKFVNANINGLWTQERFLSLILGEIPRLYDDEKGYGPRGKGFIVHVDIPDTVMKAYQSLSRKFQDILNLRQV